MEIDVKDIPFDLDFHPSAPLVATGLISGKLRLYRYAEESTAERVFGITAHKGGSCRAVRFVNSGSAILTASTDRSILATDSETGKSIARVKEAHGAEINRLVNLTENTIASGDDMGHVKVWDTRQRVCCNTFHVHDEYISDMTYVEDNMQILATSGDGRLSVCSLRRDNSQKSEFSEDELLSLVIMKNGQKVVCGTQTGALLLYSWGHFGDCSDRFLGHPESVEALLKIDEDTLISGSSDGVIRLAGILPNRIIRPLAVHGDGEPVESLAFSKDRRYLGSVSHDSFLRIWDLQELLENAPATNDGDSDDDAGAPGDDSSDEMDIDDAPSSSGGSKTKRQKKQSKGKGNWQDIDDFVADL